jgi:AcrR family transcriptional regulator
MKSPSRGEETRTRILEAAGESFSKRGYDATGVAEICQRAGVTKGAFYHHFTSKQAVFMELFNDWLEVVDSELAIAQAGAATAPEQLVRMSEMAGGVFQMADGRLPIFLEFMSEARHDPAVWQAVIAPYRRYRDYFGDFIRGGVEEGTLQPVEPDTAAQVIVSLAVGLVLQSVFDPTGADWKKVTLEGMKMLLGGLERKRGGDSSLRSE